MDKKIKARLLDLDQDVFQKVMWAKKRVYDKLKKSAPDDEASLDELSEYYDKLHVYNKLRKIHIERENLKPNSLVFFVDGTEYSRIERIFDTWDGDYEYVYAGNLPEYEGGVEELQALTPEKFQQFVDFHPEHYLGVYRTLDLHKEPGYENIKFPKHLHEVKEVILDLKELGI
jgi:hypothetical protein